MKSERNGWQDGRRERQRKKLWRTMKQDEVVSEAVRRGPQGYRARIYEFYGRQKQSELQPGNEETMERWVAGAQKRMGDWLPDSRSAKIVEIGAGSGNCLRLLQKMAYANVAGVDISPDQCKAARRWGFEVLQDEGIRFLRRQNEETDCIIALDVIEHFTKDELFEFLDAARNALRPGGWLLLQTPNAESPWGLMHRYNDITHEVGLGPEPLRHILAVVGFEQVEARESGPQILGPVSAVRWGLWRCVWLMLALWNLIEVGDIGSGVYTRNFLARARKPLRSTGGDDQG